MQCPLLPAVAGNTQDHQVGGGGHNDPLPSLHCHEQGRRQGDIQDGQILGVHHTAGLHQGNWRGATE